MNTVAIIQARMNSTRLPGKVLMDIKGKPMLQHIVDRARDSNVDNVVVATNLEGSPAINQYCHKHGIPTSSGHDSDLIDRFIFTSRHYKADVIVRLWGDCPLVLPQNINELIRAFNSMVFPYIYHNRHAGIFTLTQLNGWDDEIMDPDTRENFHLYAMNNEVSLTMGLSLSFKDSVDTLEDLEFIRGIYELLP